MRIKPEKYETMRAGMIAAVMDLGGAAKIAEQYRSYSDTRILFDVWAIALRSLPGFDQYSNGDNDSHIETALRKIGNELNLI
jgi:hypothetical protein